MSHHPNPSHKRKISFHDLNLTFKRSATGPGPLVPPPTAAGPPQLTAQQLQQQQLEHTRRADLARRQAKKPTDREIPDELASVVVGDGVERYKKLRDVERRLDAAMMRKRLDVSDNLQRRYTRREGVLRVWISNTAEGQPWQVMEEEGAGSIGLGEDGTFEFGESGQANFRVKIEGRLLDDEDEGVEGKDVQQQQQESTMAEGGGDKKGEDKASRKRPYFSHFLKSLTIEFDRNPALNPDGYSAIEWRKPAPSNNPSSANSSSPESNFDTLEFERKGDENMNVTINLVRDEKNERFKLSPLLAEILDTEEEDRAGAVQGIWEYCRAMGLQEDEDKRTIVCDEPLRKLFAKETIYFPYVPDLLLPHLHPLPPIQLAYTIRVDKTYLNGTPSDPTTTPLTPAIPPSQATIYDIRVPLPNPLVPQLTRFHTSKTHLSDLKRIVSTDDDLALLVQKIHHTNAKRKFYENLAKDPAAFIKRWTSSQQRDLEVVLAEATRGGGGGGEDGVAGEEFRRGGGEGLWGSQLARESVGLWLARGGGKAH